MKWFKKEEGVSTVCTLVENYAKEYAEEYAKVEVCGLFGPLLITKPFQWASTCSWTLPLLPPLGPIVSSPHIALSPSPSLTFIQVCCIVSSCSVIHSSSLEPLPSSLLCLLPFHLLRLFVCLTLSIYPSMAAIPSVGNLWLLLCYLRDISYPIPNPKTLDGLGDLVLCVCFVFKGVLRWHWRHLWLL